MTITDDTILRLIDAIKAPRYNDLDTALRQFMDACRRPSPTCKPALQVRPTAGLTVEQVVEEAIGDCQQWLCWDHPSTRESCQVVSVTDMLAAVRALKPESPRDPLPMNPNRERLHSLAYREDGCPIGVGGVQPDPKALLRKLREHVREWMNDLGLRIPDDGPPPTAIETLHGIALKINRMLGEGGTP